MNRMQLALLAFASTCMFAQSPDYGGPPLLGDGEPPSNTQPVTQTGFRPYVIFNQIYDSGAAIGRTNPYSPLDDSGAFGVETDVGLSGYQRWNHTLLHLDYRGDFRRFTQKTIYDGSDQSIDLRILHSIASHARLSFKESAGTLANGFGGAWGLGFVDPDSRSVPSQELSANRVNYFDTQAVFTYQKSARLAFSATADGFLVHRQFSTLFGETDYSARGEMAYRISRHTTIGAEYSYVHFAMNRFLGLADVHTLAFDYATRISRTFEVAVQMGVSRAETLGVVTVNIDPVVAAIIGQTTGFETAYERAHLPTLTARGAKNIGRGMVQIQYLHGITSGNGLWSASTTNGVTGSYAYAGIRRWNFQVAFGYSNLANLLRSAGSYGGYNGAASAARVVGKNCQLITRFDWRQYDVSPTGVSDVLTAANRAYYRATIGIAFAPGDRPLI